MSSKRRPNFSMNEINILTKEIEKNELVLNEKFNNAVTNSKKQKMWSSIANRVSSCGITERSAKEVKKKFIALQSLAKNKAAKSVRYQSGTGGGPPVPNLTDNEERLVRLIPKVAIEGVEGGIDTAMSDDSNVDSDDGDADDNNGDVEVSIILMITYLTIKSRIHYKIIGNEQCN